MEKNDCSLDEFKIVLVSRRTRVGKFNSREMYRRGIGKFQDQQNRQ